MALYAFQMVGDNAITPWSNSNEAKGIPPGSLECTQSQYELMITKSVVFPGSNIYRWLYIADVLSEEVDPRPTVEWLDTEGSGTTDGEGNVTIRVDADVSPPKIRIRHQDNALIQTDYVRIGDKKSLKLSWNNGEALLDISPDVPRVVKYDRCDLFNMINSLTIKVSAITL